MIIEVPSSISPLGISFGNIGISIEAFRTVVKASLSDNVEIKFDVSMHKDDKSVISSILSNIWRSLSEGYNLKKKVRFSVKDYIPLHVGLGSLESIAIAFCYGLALANDIELTDIELLMIANDALTSKGRTWDHLMASYYGGIVWVNPNAEPPTLIKIDPPDWLELILLVPKQRQAKYLEKVMEHFERKFSYDEIYNLTSSLASLMQGLLNDDPASLKEGLRDNIFKNIIGKIPYYMELLTPIKHEEYIGVFISRFGPSILLLLDETSADIDDVYKRLLDNISQKGIPYTAVKTTIGGGLCTKHET